MNTFKIVRLEDGKYGKKGQVQEACESYHMHWTEVYVDNEWMLAPKSECVRIADRLPKAGDEVICVDVENFSPSPPLSLCKRYKIQSVNKYFTHVYINGNSYAIKRFRPLYDQPEEAEEKPMDEAQTLHPGDKLIVTVDNPNRVGLKKGELVKLVELDPNDERKDWRVHVINKGGYKYWVGERHVRLAENAEEMVTLLCVDTESNWKTSSKPCPSQIKNGEIVTIRLLRWLNDSQYLNLEEDLQIVNRGQNISKSRFIPVWPREVGPEDEDLVCYRRWEYNWEIGELEDNKDWPSDILHEKICAHFYPVRKFAEQAARPASLQEHIEENLIKPCAKRAQEIMEEKILKEKETDDEPIIGNIVCEYCGKPIYGLEHYKCIPEDELRELKAWKRGGKTYSSSGLHFLEYEEITPKTLDTTARNAMPPQAMWRNRHES